MLQGLLKGSAMLLRPLTQHHHQSIIAKNGRKITT